MRPLKDLTNVDKAKLLHQLFPDDINHMLTFLVDSANMILNNPTLMPQDWNHKIALTTWQEQAGILKEKINEHRAQMLKESDCFAAALFKGYLDFFPIQCLKDYTLLTPHQKLADAIELFFDL